MAKLEGNDESGLFQKLRSLIVARLLIGTTLLLGTALPLEVGGFYSSSRFLFPLVTSILVLTIIYSGLLNVVKRLKILAFCQLFGDVFIETIVIIATGGIESPFTILYVITIIVASYLVPHRGSFITSSVISVIFGFIVLCQYNGWTEWWLIPVNWVLLPPPSFAIYIIFTNLVGFILTAILANSLSERLKRVDTLLKNKTVQYSYLWALNRRIVNEIQSGVVITNKEGEILSANPAAKRLFQIIDKRENGISLKDLFPDYLSESILRISERGEATRKEVNYQIDDGWNSIWLLIEVIPLERKSQDPARVMLLMKDVTDQRRFEEIKRKAQRWSTVAEVSAGMAHEIRNPLASISGSIEVLRDQMTLTDSQNRLMGIVLRESSRLNKLISDFLDLARPRSPEFSLESINTTINEVILLVGSEDSMSKSVELNFNESTDLIQVEVDKDQFTQMLWNLLRNAIDASSSDGKVTITSEICNDPGHLQRVLEYQPLPPFFRLTVEDNGVGMDQDILTRIFDPFITFKRKGVGIGLAIVYRIVENHKGTIRVSSRPGKGTTFMIDFPLRQPEPVKTSLKAEVNH